MIWRTQDRILLEVNFFPITFYTKSVLFLSHKSHFDTCNVISKPDTSFLIYKKKKRKKNCLIKSRQPRYSIHPSPVSAEVVYLTIFATSAKVLYAQPFFSSTIYCQAKRTPSAGSYVSRYPVRTIGILNSPESSKREPTSFIIFQHLGFIKNKKMVGRLSSRLCVCVKIVNKQFVARDSVLWLFYRGFTGEVMSILGSLRWQMNRCNWVSICDMISLTLYFDMSERVKFVVYLVTVRQAC